MLKSIRWKFITIYFLLVFIAMVIIGVFLLQQFEQYHLGVVRGNITQIANSVMITLDDIDWSANKKDVQQNISDYEKMGMEIYVVDKDSNFTMIASTNASYLNQNAMHILSHELILGAFNGEIKEKDFLANDEVLRSSKDMTFPLYDEHSRVIGAIYLRKNLDDIYKTLQQSRVILIRATVLALLITIVLGYFIAKSITGPINDVTIKAEKMAKGDFDQVVEVRSDDEIGQLANMFNYLTARLKSVLSEMSNEKKKMDTIITYMADGLIASTKEGKIIHANPRAQELLSLTEKDLEEKTFNQIFAKLNNCLTLDYLKNHESHWSGSQIIQKDSSMTIRANYAPFMNQKGDFGGVIMLLQDVTEHERLENMRREFVANVSHELKTPLTTIKSYTETLLDGALEDRDLSKQFLEVVDSEADRMTRLVRDLLQLSNLDFKQTNWNKKDVCLDEIIDKSIIKLKVFAKNKNQNIYYDKKEQDIRLFADKDGIEQVVLNIISNSIKYTPENGEIVLQCERDINIARITVQDNGIGIPANDLPRIFERFYRVDKARSREQGGTGLGLSIAKQIIEGHGGNIHIQSSENKGTKVFLELPLR